MGTSSQWRLSAPGRFQCDAARAGQKPLRMNADAGRGVCAPPGLAGRNPRTPRAPALLLFVLLWALPGFALAEACTCGATEGAFDWTSIDATVPAGRWQGCTPSAQDTFTIRSGCSVSIPDNSTVTFHAAPSTTLIKVERGGAICVEAGGELELGNQGLFVQAGGTFNAGAKDSSTDCGGRILTFGTTTPTFTLTTPVTDLSDPYPTLYEVRYCPVDSAGTLVSDCETGDEWKAAICCPEASCNLGSTDGAANGEVFWDDFVGAVEDGNVLVWYDPGGEGYGARDFHAPYEVIPSGVDTSATDRCIIVDLRQGCRNATAGCPHEPTAVGNDPISLSERGVKQCDISVDLQKGAEVVTCDDTDVVTADKQLVARYLSCPLNGILPGWSAKIRATTDGGAGGDTLTLDALGLRQDVNGGAATVSCYVDYGWRQGDAFFITRMARVGSSTVNSQVNREDSLIEFLGTSDVNLTLFDEIGGAGAAVRWRNSVPTAYAEANTGNYPWFRDIQLGTATVSIQDPNATAGETLTGWMLTGSGVDDDHEHPMFFTDSTAAKDVTFDGLSFRHAGDDPLSWSGPVLGDFTFNRTRVSFTSGGGGSCGGADAQSNTTFTATFTDWLSENGGCDDSSTSNSLFQDWANDGQVSIRNVVSFVHTGFITNRGNDVQNVYSETLDLVSGTFGVAYSLVDFTMRNPVVRHNGGIGSIFGQGASPDANRRIRRGIVYRADNLNTTGVNVTINGAFGDALMEDIIFVDPTTSGFAASNHRFFDFFNCDAPSTVRRFSPIFTGEVPQEIDYGFRMLSSGCSKVGFDNPQVTLDGLLITRMQDDDGDGIAIALYSSNTINSEVIWPTGPCTYDNERDWRSANDMPPSGSVSGRPISFTSRYEVEPGTWADEHGCGARTVGARDMWALRVIGLSDDPFVRSSSGSPACGNAVLESAEECDDGNDVDWDGCSAACELEDELPLYGTAQGGEVRVSVDGVSLVVPTTAGQTAEQVAAAVAAAINADPTLQAAGVTALADGSSVLTNGSFTSVEITDEGLRAFLEIGALPPAAFVFLAGLLTIAAAIGLRRLRV